MPCVALVHADVCPCHEAGRGEASLTGRRPGTRRRRPAAPGRGWRVRPPHCPGQRASRSGRAAASCSLGSASAHRPPQRRPNTPLRREGGVGSAPERRVHGPPVLAMVPASPTGLAPSTPLGRIHHRAMRGGGRPRRLKRGLPAAVAGTDTPLPVRARGQIKRQRFHVRPYCPCQPGPQPRSRLQVRHGHITVPDHSHGSRRVLRLRPQPLPDGLPLLPQPRNRPHGVAALLSKCFELCLDVLLLPGVMPSQSALERRGLGLCLPRCAAGPVRLCLRGVHPSLGRVPLAPQPSHGRTELLPLSSSRFPTTPLRPLRRHQLILQIGCLSLCQRGAPLRGCKLCCKA